MTAREVLMKTRRLFTAGHWTRGRLKSHNYWENKDLYCLVGGLRQSAFGTVAREEMLLGNENYGAYRDAYRAVGVACGGEIIVQFNDRQSSVEPIIDVLDKAIRSVEKKEAATA